MPEPAGPPPPRPPTPLSEKSSTAEIAARFDADVARFTDRASGQATVPDAALMAGLLARAALAHTPTPRRVLDLGCGAGNATLTLRDHAAGPFAADLLDLSGPMLEAAERRVTAAGVGPVRTLRGDFRTAALPAGHYDVVLAAAVLHPLRDDDDWAAAFAKLYEITAPGGGVWVTDLVAHALAPVGELMWEGYGDFLDRTGGPGTRERVFEYIDREDSPRPVPFQLDLLREVGFGRVELLHKTGPFAAFGAVKAA